MSDTTCQMSISLDGFVAGPEHSRDNPLGKRGREPHGWHTGGPRATGADKTANGWLMRPRGAYVMGRNMFGRFAVSGMRRGTDVGDPSPTYHAPVFVLTHHTCEPIEREGETTFNSSLRASTPPTRGRSKRPAAKAWTSPGALRQFDRHSTSA